MLVDGNLNGLFDDVARVSYLTDYVVVDLNGDGRLETCIGCDETFLLNQVFSVGGEPFKVGSVSPDGELVTVQRGKWGVLTGTVESFSAGLPIAGAHIVIEGEHGVAGEVVTDANGNFAISLLEGGGDVYRLTVGAWGYRNRTSRSEYQDLRPVTVTPDRIVPIRIVLEPALCGGTIEGCRSATIVGGYPFDLDTGTFFEGADFFWDFWTTNPYLSPQNGAKFAVFGAVEYDSITLEHLQTAVYSTKQIAASTTNNLIPAGTVLGVITSQGRYTKLRIDEYGRDL